MALDPSILHDALLQLSTTAKPPDPFTAASRIASAYREYALAGTALGMPLVLPGPGVVTMDLALGSAFSVLPGAPPVVAAGFASMLTAYWTLATFAPFPAPGIAAPPTGLVVMTPILSALLVVPNPAEVYAAAVAAALHAATITTLVTFIQPSGPPLSGFVV